ncbi:hypothetical protein [Streptomyces sp. MJP52]|uniref:hypothetical protein n=1 Tax=Streptomyces sp. MJP52 TaxID=2940555 RepID=UPI002473BD15|nr:hypothetical protein [Streptomyces sp. MJP52]MDH6224388.1 hypothetical protein [Streptomyces sp. MJP52]
MERETREQWELGVCFRHPGKGRVPTIHVRTIRPAAGGLLGLRACRDCAKAIRKADRSSPARAGRSRRSVA